MSSQKVYLPLAQPAKLLVPVQRIGIQWPQPLLQQLPRVNSRRTSTISINLPLALRLKSNGSMITVMQLFSQLYLSERPHHFVNSHSSRIHHRLIQHTLIRNLHHIRHLPCLKATQRTCLLIAVLQ